MKKRVLALLLCLLMVLPMMLTSCDNSDNPDNTTKEEESVYVKPATLNFYIVGEAVSDSAAAAMQEAFNARSVSLFKTKVEFIFCTAEEYKAKVKADLDAADAISGESAATKFENAEVETSLNMLNVPIETYPEIYDNQVDILLINSKEMFDELRAEGYLADITEKLKTDFSDIPQRVNSNLIDGAAVNGKMYAVPNNVLVGHYEYVLVHKDMAYLAAYLQEKDFLTFNDTSKKDVLDYSMILEFAETIQSFKENDDPIYQTMLTKYGVSEIFPMKATFEYPTVAYFPKGELVGEGASATKVYNDTLFGVVYEYNSTYGTKVQLDNVLSNQYYRDHLGLMIEAKAQNFCPTAATENAAYGVMYMEGSYTDRFLYEDDYFVYEVDQPRLEDDAAFGAMFAVSSFTASVDRSLEIIQALVAGTDEGEVELRNILQYGVEGIHYTIDKENNLVTRKNSEYVMNANYTGNLVTAYPCDADGRGVTFTSYFTLQNKDAKRNPIYGVTTDQLWSTTLNNMVNRALCEKMLVLLRDEINALEDTNEIFSGVIDKAQKRKDLVAGIPSQITYTTTAAYNKGYNALVDYWCAIRAGYDPLPNEDGEPAEIPTIPYDVEKQLKDELKVLKADLTTDAEAFIAEAVELASTYMERALACTTKAELDALCDEFAALAKDKDNGVYFYNNRSTSDWGAANATNFFGMLYSTNGSEVYPSTLSGALLNWYNITVMGMGE